MDRGGKALYQRMLEWCRTQGIYQPRAAAPLPQDADDFGSEDDGQLPLFDTSR